MSAVERVPRAGGRGDPGPVDDGPGRCRSGQSLDDAVLVDELLGAAESFFDADPPPSPEPPAVLPLEPLSPPFVAVDGFPPDE